MKLIPFFWGISFVIIPVQLFAQKDTLKPNWGINNLQIEIAQSVDVCAYYNKHLLTPPSFKGSLSIFAKNKKKIV
jgi:hypothetical protein